LFSIDPLSAILATSALWIAHLAFKASCGIWVTILKVEGGYSRSVYDPDHSFIHVTIRNLGLPLHATSVHLCFRTRDGENVSLAMQQVEYRNRHKVVSDGGELPQGMTSVFRLTSIDLRAHQSFGLAFLRKVDNPRRCNARIQVHSQGFLVAEFHLCHWSYWIKSRWNSLAYRVNRMLDRTITVSDGTTRLKSGRLLPKFNVESQFRFECFVKDTLLDSRQEQSLEPLNRTDVR
jgi:hypothetical protein